MPTVELTYKFVRAAKCAPGRKATDYFDVTVKGLVLRKIKGGLLVDIGVPVFLPASQVNIRRAGDIGDWIGKEIEARIIKIDEERMNCHPW